MHRPGHAMLRVAPTGSDVVAFFTPALILAGCLGLEGIPGTDSGVGGLTDTGPSIATFGGMSFPSAVDFGRVELGVQETVDVVLTNESSSNVTISEILLDAPAAFDAEYTSVPWVIGSGGQYVITLSFLPTTEGVQAGTLSFGVDGVDGLADIQISGEGWAGGDTGVVGDGGSGGGDGGGSGDGGASAGSLSYSTTSINFGTVPVGSSDTENVVIVNEGSDPVMISNITSSDSAFSTSGLTTPVEIAGSSSKTLQVRFSPTAARAYSGTVTVQTELGNQAISVQGVGEAGATLGPIIDVSTSGSSSTSLEFVSILDIPDTKSVRVTNIGDAALTVSNVYLNNDATGGTFTISGTRSGTLAAGESLTFSISYTCYDLCADIPLTLTDTNIAHILSNDPSRPDWTIELWGL
ncbi:MAG: choice-of-anchor D domain-containing protein [Deltaproteobacteria bacterium]|nr:MAG: choice-of-anchor D domain-containing protein [Deltaproteobacteria bacterium]